MERTQMGKCVLRYRKAGQEGIRTLTTEIDSSLDVGSGTNHGEK
jgi:hypothetical protein